MRQRHGTIRRSKAGELGLPALQRLASVNIREMNRWLEAMSDPGTALQGFDVIAEDCLAVDINLGIYMVTNYLDAIHHGPCTHRIATCLAKGRDHAHWVET